MRLKLKIILGCDQRGITRPETTAIVLIALVTVVSSLAFASLTTGLFAGDKSKDNTRSGLAEAGGTLAPKGAVVLTASTTGASGVVSEIAFQLALSAGGEPVDLTPGKTIIKYTDGVQSRIFDSPSGFTVSALVPTDYDNLLERGELYEIKLIDVDNLGVSTDFTLLVIPSIGVALSIERRTPALFDKVMVLN